MSLGSSPLAPVASAVVGGTAAATFGLGSRYFRFLPRRLVERIVPKPGTGPSPAARERGYYRIETYTTTTSGARYVARMEQRGDPGYKATSVLLGESGLALAFDRDKLPPLYGVLTPRPQWATRCWTDSPARACPCRSTGSPGDPAHGSGTYMKVNVAP